MHRFFVDPSCIENGHVSFTGGAAHQISRVLRARPGEQVVVLDDTGWKYLVRLDTVAVDEVRGSIEDRTPVSGEPRVPVTLYQALLKSDSFEFVLQKGTELGVSTFVPVQSSRSVARAASSSTDGTRAVRWRRIIQEAAEQSNRGRLPTLSPPVPFRAAIESVAGLAVIPWEREAGTGLKAVLDEYADSAGGISIYTGPEGGFTADEVEQAHSSGIVPVTLGKRILRAETAAIVTVSAVMYEIGELG